MFLATAQAAAPADTLVLQVMSERTTLDPAQAYDAASYSVVENLYETLVTYSGADFRRPVPLLARSWAVNPSGRVYTFTLRQGVKFHSGRRFTCADASYSLRRLLVTNNADSGNWFISQTLLGTPSNAADDASVTWAKIAAAVRCDAQGRLVLSLPKADPTLLAQLASQNVSIVDSGHARAVGEWDGTQATWKKWVGRDLSRSALNTRPSGTGAYRLLSQRAGTVLAQAFPDYWGGTPKLKSVVVQTVAEEATRVLALELGDADLVDLSSRESLKQFRNLAALTLIDQLPSLSTPVVLLNQNIQNPSVLGSGKLDGQGIPKNFFGDVHVRKAFNYAFDEQRFIREATASAAQPRSMALPPGFLGYNAAVPAYHYDLVRSAAEFRAAFGGQVWQKGFVLTVHYPANNESAKVTLELLKKAVESLNPAFRINIQSKPLAELLTEGKAGRLALSTASWSPDYVDPDNVMYTLYASDGYYHARTGFQDAQIDGWLEHARQVTNPQVRAADYVKVARRAHELAPYLILPAEPTFMLFKKNLVGVTRATFNPMLGGGVLWRNLSK